MRGEGILGCQLRGDLIGKSRRQTAADVDPGQFGVLTGGIRRQFVLLFLKISLFGIRLRAD